MSFRYRHGDRPLEGYTIQRGVGRGGFGEVYYAVSDGGREVALKSILQNTEIELRGVQQCINLKSPHLVAIFDVKMGDDQTPFVIMEYVAGPSIRDLLHEHPEGLGPQKTAYLAREIAKGLAYLHERGIVHRDLKPENIFYEDGYVKIGDYGLSKFISVSRQSGQTISVGTVHYMAPEIGSGIYNQGIDIYALGVIVHELLTGRLPFTGDSFGEILMKHLTAKPDLDDIDEPFRQVVARSLEKKPEDRYPSVDDLVRDLFRSEQVSVSVSRFNPGTLSTVAQTAGRFAADLPILEKDPEFLATPSARTLPPGIPSPARPRSPPRAPAAGRKAPAREARPAAEARPHGGGIGAPGPGVGLATPPPAPRKRAGSPATAEAPAAAPPRPTPVTLESLDPLDGTQRLARALFIGGLFAAAVAVLGQRVAGAFGFLVAAASGTGAVLLTEGYLADRFQINRGFPRGLVAAVVAALPVSVGWTLWDARAGTPGTSCLAVLASIAFMKWDARTTPLRDERISIHQAILPAILGGLVLASALQGNMVFVGAVVAACSLIVNAASPFVPYDLRKLHGLKKGRSAPRPRGVARPHTARPVARPRATARVADGVPVLEPASTHAYRRDADIPGVPPGPAARVFWLLVAGLFAAGGASCLVASVVMAIENPNRGYPDEILACISFGVGLLTYMGLGFYRGLWVRSRGIWKRELKPFLVTTAIATMAVAFAMGLFGPMLDHWPADREETVICVSVFLTGLVSLLMLLAVEAIMLRSPRPLHWSSVAQIPWHERPVPVALRFVESVLGFVAIALTLVFWTIGLLGHTHPDERIALFVSGIVSVTLGIFFLRQALRRRRGTIWQGSIRPFLITICSGSILSSMCVFAHELEHGRMGNMHSDVAITFAVITVFAAVLLVFVLFLKGGTPSSGRADLPLEPPRRAPTEGTRRGSETRRSRRPRTVATASSALGTLLWMFGVPVAVLDALLEVRGLARVIGPESLLPDGGGLPAVWIPALAVGSLLILVSRRRAGFLHFARAFAGLAALAVAAIFLFTSLDCIMVSPELIVGLRGPRAEFVFQMVCVLAFVAAGLLLVSVRLKRVDNDPRVTEGDRLEDLDHDTGS